MTLENKGCHTQNTEKNGRLNGRRISQNGRIKRNRQVCIISLKFLFLVGYGRIGRFDICLTCPLKKKKQFLSI